MGSRQGHLRFRWTDEAGRAGTFEAGGPHTLARASMDPLIDLRAATVRRDGGARHYPDLWLHVEVAPTRWVRCGHARGFVQRAADPPDPRHDHTMLPQIAEHFFALAVSAVRTYGTHRARPLWDERPWAQADDDD